MASAIRTISHEDRLSLVDHLQELRTRLIVCVAVFTVVFGVCLWQNHALLNIINAPLTKQTKKQVRKGHGTTGQAVLAQEGLLNLATADEQVFKAFAAEPSLPAPLRADSTAAAARIAAAVAQVPRNPQGDLPVTLGVGEPFTTTLTVAVYFALVISLPVILFELYGFILPAFSPRERRVALPLMLAIPVLFVAGVMFGYFVVLQAAVRFFQNFNSGEFNVLVQANQYYKFAATILLAMGIVFQVPVGILAITRAGIVTPKQLRRNRRYAIVLCAAVAAFLPGDAVTLILETVPLYLLFEASILLAAIVARRDARRAAAEAQAASGAGAASPTASDERPVPVSPSGEPIAPDVQDIIDHFDSDLSG